MSKKRYVPNDGAARYTGRSHVRSNPKLKHDGQHGFSGCHRLPPLSLTQTDHGFSSSSSLVTLLSSDLANSSVMSLSKNNCEPRKITRDLTSVESSANHPMGILAGGSIRMLHYQG